MQSNHHTRVRRVYHIDAARMWYNKPSNIYTSSITGGHVIKALEKGLERILQKVRRPARYTGGEYGQIIKDKETVDIRIAFCFPDTYEIGMSYHGLHIMYGVLNGLDGVWCERVFAPWADMEEQMRKDGMRLFSLESGDLLTDFDIIAFSIGHELTYANILNMLDLSGLALKSSERSGDDPLVIAGGICCFNPEPLADFIDLFVIGEGEEAISELIALLREYRVSNRPAQLPARNPEQKRNRPADGGQEPVISGKKAFLKCAPQISGVYVPSQYDISYKADGTVNDIMRQDGAPFPVMKRLIKDLDASYQPQRPIVPSTSLVHERAVLELFRGCVRGCRFCMAGHVNRPMRQRSYRRLVRSGIEQLESTGYDEISLLSLSTSDYECLFELCDGLIEYCQPRMINLSLPSLRVDNFSMELLERVQKVRRSGLTFAPEAGSQRLRDAINKNITESELLETCRVAFEGGYNSIKLYFMLGLPTETDEDIIAIANLSRTVLDVWKRHAANKSRGIRITVSASCFVPKPHTPFQWEPQIPVAEFTRRAELLKASLLTKAITFNWHSPEQAYVEAALARGDRRIGAVIEDAWRRGARFDSWSESFSIDRWLSAFCECGLDPDFYSCRERENTEVMPWSVVTAGLSSNYLWEERMASRESEQTPDCRKGCSACGVCGAVNMGTTNG